jgi:hypothetical protein
MQDQGQNFGYGQQTPWDSTDEFNVIAFIIRQMMARLDSMKLVRVEAVSGGGAAAGPPTVDVLPLVSEIDGFGNAIPHGVVHGLPTFRLQGGICAIVLDPAAGDVGWVVAADRDISNAKANPGQQVTPGSYRKFDIADGVYAGALFGAAPTCYVQLKGDGTIHVQDAAGNSVATGPLGLTLSDANGNQIQTRAGFVNVVTPSFQVNGVPVIVP